MTKAAAQPDPTLQFQTPPEVQQNPRDGGGGGGGRQLEEHPALCQGEPRARLGAYRDLTKLRNHQERPPAKHHQPEPHFTGLAASDPALQNHLRELLAVPPQEDFPPVTFETWKEPSPKAAALQAACCPNGTGTAPPPGSFVPPNNFGKEKRFAQQNCPGTSSAACSKKAAESTQLPPKERGKRAQLSPPALRLHPPPSQSAPPS